MKDFDVDRVVIDVYTAPKSRMQMRITHRVIHQDVRHRVAVNGFRSAGIEARERRGVLAVLHARRHHARQNRLARDPVVDRGQVIVLVESGRDLALRDRVIPAVRHVLFAGPEHLYWRARHFLGDENRLANVVLRCCTAAESAAEERLVDLALRHRQAARFRCGRQCGFAVLRRTPYLALVGRITDGRVLRLHGGMVLIGIGVDRLELLGGAVKRRL